jgi:hypothetical protein
VFRTTLDARTGLFVVAERSETTLPMIGDTMSC